MDVGIRTLTEQDINTLSTTKQVQFGATGMTEDGRRYRYVGFGGTLAITAGKLMTAPITTNTTAGYQGLTITAIGTGAQVTANLAIGATQIVITNGATAITQDQFAEGYLEIAVGGNSTSVTATYSYRIKGNTAAAASATFTVYLAEPLRNTTALIAGTDTANLNVSIYSGVTVNAGAATTVPVGVTVLPIVNSASVTNYGWIQTAGPALVITDGSAILTGGGIGQSATAGVFALSTAAAAGVLGFARAANGSAVAAIPAVLNIN